MTEMHRRCSKSQIDSSLDLLPDWVYENSGSVPFSIFEHPKFNFNKFYTYPWLLLYNPDMSH